MCTLEELRHTTKQSHPFLALFQFRIEATRCIYRELSDHIKISAFTWHIAAYVIEACEKVLLQT